MSEPGPPDPAPEHVAWGWLGLAIAGLLVGLGLPSGIPGLGIPEPLIAAWPSALVACAGTLIATVAATIASSFFDTRRQSRQASAARS